MTMNYTIYNNNVCCAHQLKGSTDTWSADTITAAGSMVSGLSVASIEKLNMDTLMSVEAVAGPSDAWTPEKVTLHRCRRCII